MRTVNISQLKANLSAHLQLVQDGEEVLVCDRDRPVARIIPVHTEEFSEQERRLIARGILTPPLRRRKPSDRLPEPQGNVSDEVMQQIWDQEREGR
ncbi:MAG: type II toxin-antitoxin system prevent-host-death family antitoxin [Candidatus Korobacteraceae bacterium]